MVFAISMGMMLWLGCGALGYAYTYTYFQTEYDIIAIDYRKSDRRMALAVACLGPLGLLGCWVVGQCHRGFK